MKEMRLALSCEGRIGFPWTEEGGRANLAVGTTEQRHRGGKARDALGKE